MDSNTKKNNELGRREFLGKALGATLSLAVVPSILTCACDAFAKNEPLSFSPIKVDLTLSKNAPLKNINGSVIVSTTIRIIITRISDTEFSAVDGSCTHEGFNLNPFNSTTKLITCTKHTSTFDEFGKIIHMNNPPNQRSLNRYKATYDGNTIVTIEDTILATENTANYGFSIEQNFPNPFSTTSTIRFTLSESSSVSIHIRNISGEEMQFHSLGKLGMGEHSLNLDGSQLATGTYFYELRTERGSLFKQMEIIR